MLKACFIGCAALLALAGPSLASPLADAPGDFLASYTGPQNGDLDILSASVRFDGSHFHLSSTVNGAVGSTPGALYVWGINRGAGLPRLTFGTPSVGGTAPFDAVAVLFPDGLGRAVTFPLAGPPSITPLPGLVSVDGSTISASFQASLFPTNGLAPQDYTFTLWSRARVSPLMDGTNAEIADFAPDVGGMTSTVPEPGAWALMIVGFGVMGAMLRRRDRLAPAAPGTQA